MNKPFLYIYIRVLLALFFLAIFGKSLAMTTHIESETIMQLIDKEMSAGHYRTASSCISNYFDSFLNTPLCDFARFSVLMKQQKYCYQKDGREEEYMDYKADLLSKVDQSKQGLFLKILLYLVEDCKTDYRETSNLWHSYSFHGEIGNSLNLLNKYSECINRKSLTAQPFIPIWLDLVRADLCIYGSNYNLAQGYIDNAMLNVKQAYGSEDPEFYIVMMMQEVLYAYQNEFEKSIKIALEVLDFIKRKYKSCKELYSVNSRLFYYYSKIGNIDKATEYGSNSETRQSVFENADCFFDYNLYTGSVDTNSFSQYLNSVDYIFNTLLLAEVFFQKQDILNAAKHSRRVLYRLEKDISNRYTDFSFNQASNELKKKVDYLVDYAPLYSSRLPEDSLVQSLTYNASLINKQLSLNAEKLFRKQIIELNNRVLFDRYKELDSLLTEIGNSSNISAVDSLFARTIQLENNLKRHLFNRLRNASGYSETWQDVQTALNTDEIAIEITTYFEVGKKYYVASILRSDARHPVSVILFSEEELAAIDRQHIDASAFSLFWSKLTPHLNGVKRIFISPSGELFNYPFEYYVSPCNNLPMAEQYQVYRLSSTREIITRTNSSGEEINAALFGGIVYKVTDDALTAEDKSSKCTINDEIDMTAVLTRAGFAYLPETKSEVENISLLLRTHNQNAAEYKGEEATETLVKSLSGSYFNILHFATHGFFIRPNSRNRISRLMSNMVRTTFEDQSLSRSGLLFAGAQNSIELGKKKANQIEDGLLTAREISRLDFTNVNLAVLSSCESGLGDISSEGIFGLQRGLKRAGVKSIIMSLWKVDDKATSLLMQQFYRYFIKSSNVRESFIRAQRYLREYNNHEYDNPVHWASFVLLDNF